MRANSPFSLQFILLNFEIILGIKHDCYGIQILSTACILFSQLFFEEQQLISYVPLIFL